MQILVKDLTIQKPQGEHHHTHGDGDPEGPKGRTPIASPDVVQSQGRPQLAAPPTLSDVSKRLSKLLRLHPLAKLTQ